MTTDERLDAALERLGKLIRLHECLADAVERMTRVHALQQKVDEAAAAALARIADGVLWQLCSRCGRCRTCHQTVPECKET